VTTHIPNVTLNNTVEMLRLGYGVFQIPPDEIKEAVATALTHAGDGVGCDRMNSAWPRWPALGGPTSTEPRER
jgi:hypothetical protein